MSYPYIARDNKKNVRIKSQELEIIKYLYNSKNWSKVKIAGFFNVEPETIRRNLDPKIRKRRNERQNNYHKKRYAEDEIFRNKAKKFASNWVKMRYKIDPDYRKYRNASNKLYRNKNLDKCHLTSKKYRQDHKEEISLKASLKHYKKRLDRLEKKI